MIGTIAPIWQGKGQQGKREKVHRVFHMENETGEKTTVCQKIFLSTLGLTTENTIQTVLTKYEGSRTISNVSDKSVKRIPGNKILNDISDKVGSHMLRFNPSISNCC